MHRFSYHTIYHSIEISENFSKKMKILDAFSCINTELDDISCSHKGRASGRFRVVGMATSNEIKHLGSKPTTKGEIQVILHTRRLDKQ